MPPSSLMSSFRRATSPSTLSVQCWYLLGWVEKLTSSRSWPSMTCLNRSGSVMAFMGCLRLGPFGLFADGCFGNGAFQVFQALFQCACGRVDHGVGAGIQRLAAREDAAQVFHGFAGGAARGVKGPHVALGDHAGHVFFGAGLEPYAVKAALQQV